MIEIDKRFHSISQSEQPWHKGIVGFTFACEHLAYKPMIPYQQILEMIAFVLVAGVDRVSKEIEEWKQL